MNLVEIINRFPTEIDAIKYFESIRWKKGIKCPYCYSEKIGSRNIDNRWHCKECKKTFFVTTKTNLNRTHISLRTWLMSFALITDAKKGVSALQLKRNLGLNYETAYVRDIAIYSGVSRHISENEVAIATTANAKALFRLKDKN